jgi:hypothetical protein
MMALHCWQLYLPDQLALARTLLRTLLFVVFSNLHIS